MKLSKAERLLLYNQYNILKSIKDNSFMTETYNNYQEILLKGHMSTWLKHGKVCRELDF